MSAAHPPFPDPSIERAFAAFPEPQRRGLLRLRELIYETAAETPGVGRVEEVLKWRQPAYLTPETKSGSTIRLGLSKQGGFAIYVHCQTTILSDVQAVFPDSLTYEGNRAVHFVPGHDLQLEEIRLLVVRALTYHLRK